MATNPVSGTSLTPSAGPVASSGSALAAPQMATNQVNSASLTPSAGSVASSGSALAAPQMATNQVNSASLTPSTGSVTSNGSTATAQMDSTMAAATAALVQASGILGALPTQAVSSAAPVGFPAMLPIPFNVARGKKKRKNAAPAINVMRRKRIRPTLIDDRVVISIFRELRLTRAFIHSGALLAWSLPPTHPDFNNIHDYLERGQEHGYGLKIVSILRVIPAATSLADDNVLVDCNDNPNTRGLKRMILLQNGLRLATYTGQMYGPGIYFADRVSKSSNYCDANVDEGYLWLCDVALGTMYQAFNAIPRLRSAPNGSGGVPTQSVMGMGKRIPEPSWAMTIDGTIWPMGQTIDRNDKRAYLQFNEYVVYDTSQVQPKYLIKFQMTQTPVKSILY